MPFKQTALEFFNNRSSVSQFNFIKMKKKNLITPENVSFSVGSNAKWNNLLKYLSSSCSVMKRKWGRQKVNSKDFRYYLELFFVKKQSVDLSLLRHQLNNRLSNKILVIVFYFYTLPLKNICLFFFIKIILDYLKAH